MEADLGPMTVAADVDAAAGADTNAVPEPPVAASTTEADASHVANEADTPQLAEDVDAGVIPTEAAGPDETVVVEPARGETFETVQTVAGEMSAVYGLEQSEAQDIVTNQIQPAQIKVGEEYAIDEGVGLEPFAEGEMVESNIPKASLSESFREVALKIETQNNIINSLKDKIKEKIEKFPRTLCEENEIRNLNVCIQKEQQKLRCCLDQILRLHEKDPNRIWPAVSLATTYTEDCKPIQLHLFSPFDQCFDIAESLTNIKYTRKCSREMSSDSSLSRSSYSDLFRNLDPKKRKSYRHVPREHDPLFQKLRPENRRGNSLDPKKRLLPRYANVNLEKCKKPKRTKVSKYDVIECIQEKVEKIQKELCSLDRVKQAEKSASKKPALRKVHTHLEDARGDRCTRELANVVTRIQDVLGCDRSEKESENDASSSQSDIPCRDLKSDVDRISEHKKAQSCSPYPKTYSPALKDRYYDLLEEYKRKSAEVSKLKATINSLGGERPKSRSTPVDSEGVEVRWLREKLKQCQENCHDLKVIVSEQASQIDDYRSKYMTSLQKTEEQRVILHKMECDNQRVEEQINHEIQQIKDQFNLKLKEYAQFPQLLENEQIKLAECCRQKADLEIKLRIVCREYRLLRASKDQRPAALTENVETSKRLADELANLKQQHDMLKEYNDRLLQQYDQVRNELDVLRTESAKIIVRLKERAAANQASLYKHIDELEKDLAKCRASACLSLSDRDEVIRDMQAQLNCLALSFDSSQKQIKTLKDHIAYLSNGKMNSVMIYGQVSSGEK